MEIRLSEEKKSSGCKNFAIGDRFVTQEGVTSLRQRKRDLKDHLQLREGWGEVSAEQQKYKNRF